MKRAEKEENNRSFEKDFNSIFENGLYYDYETEKRLYSCKAWFFDGVTRNGEHRYIILRSYSTVVAIFDTYTTTLYDALRLVYGYTATSAQHIAKFRNYIRDYFNLGWDEIKERRYL